MPIKDPGEQKPILMSPVLSTSVFRLKQLTRFPLPRNWEKPILHFIFPAPLLTTVSFILRPFIPLWCHQRHQGLWVCLALSSFHTCGTCNNSFSTTDSHPFPPTPSYPQPPPPTHCLHQSQWVTRRGKTSRKVTAQTQKTTLSLKRSARKKSLRAQWVLAVAAIQ